MTDGYVTRDELLEQVAEQAATLTVQAARIAELEAQVATLTARLAELERRDPPAGVKANRVKPSRPRPPRKRRAVNHARRREIPTAVVTHALSQCPACGSELGGGEVVGRRQIIEIPPVAASITEHVTLARRCSTCEQRHTPVVDLGTEVLGQHRLGLRLMASIVVLREYHRLPVGQVQRHLRVAYGLQISQGEIVAVLALAAARGTAAATAIRDAIRTSPVAHMDETSWREDGQNGYLWSLSTPTLHYYERGRRQKGMVDRLLGEHFSGVLVTDFYAAYDHYPGPHQRCWVHLLRDSHELLRKHPRDAALGRWARALKRLYQVACREPGPPAALAAGEQAAWRRRRQRQYEACLQRLCEPYSRRAVPQRVLCQRSLKYLPELFTFIADPRVPADNNAAERSVRPLAVIRKISGGTRSAAGSLTRTVLWTLTATWQAQGKHLLDAWTALLRDPSIAPV